jgi:hypothetical protein
MWVRRILHVRSGPVTTETDERDRRDGQRRSLVPGHPPWAAQTPVYRLRKAGLVAFAWKCCEANSTSVVYVVPLPLGGPAFQFRPRSNGPTRGKTWQPLGRALVHKAHLQTQAGPPLPSPNPFSCQRPIHVPWFDNLWRIVGIERPSSGVVSAWYP